MFHFPRQSSLCPPSMMLFHFKMNIQVLIPALISPLSPLGKPIVAMLAQPTHWGTRRLQLAPIFPLPVIRPTCIKPNHDTHRPIFTLHPCLAYPALTFFSLFSREGGFMLYFPGLATRYSQQVTQVLKANTSDWQPNEHSVRINKYDGHTCMKEGGHIFRAGNKSRGGDWLSDHIICQFTHNEFSIIDSAN